jgi:hypothetical protein
VIDVTPTRLERYLPLITAVALIMSPIASAWAALIVSRDASQSLKKDYVAIAVQVLNGEKSTPAMRAWATKVLVELSPVAVDNAAAADLSRLGTGQVSFRFPPPPIDLTKPLGELEPLQPPE